MSLSEMARIRLDHYLADLRRALAAVPAQVRDEQVCEIESHLIDACADGEGDDDQRMLRAIERMGPPDAYAGALLVEARLRAATRGFQPREVFAGLLQRMALGMGGALGGLLFALGYLMLLIVAIAVLAKPFVPESGLWLHPGGGWSLSLHAHEGSREVLGWWLVPVGLAILALGWTLLNRTLRWLLNVESRRSRR